MPVPCLPKVRPVVSHQTLASRPSRHYEPLKAGAAATASTRVHVAIDAVFGAPDRVEAYSSGDTEHVRRLKST